MSSPERHESMHTPSPEKHAKEILPYQFEPEYPAGDELPQIDPSEICIPVQQHAAIAAGRSQQLDATGWCMCGDCEKCSTDIQCVCCHEVAETKNIRGDLFCVTESLDFQNLVVFTGALSLLRHQKLLDVKNKKKRAKLEKEPPSNDLWRYLAYCQFVHIINAGCNLGKGKRVVIPSCVVLKIKERYPSPSGKYTGFKEWSN